MIQRWQSLLLLLAFVAAVVCLWLPLGSVELEVMGTEPVLYNIALAENGSSGVSCNFSYIPLFIILSLAACLELTCIFLYKNRMLQIRLCGICLFLIFIWIALFMYYKMVDLPKMGAFNQDFGAYLPFISAVLVYFAYRAIRRDERLVRAADRIRG